MSETRGERECSNRRISLSYRLPNEKKKKGRILQYYEGYISRKGRKETVVALGFLTVRGRCVSLSPQSDGSREGGEERRVSPSPLGSPAFGKERSQCLYS